YDDYSDIRLAGSAAAAPIWAEFMKRAVQLPAYRNSQPFTPPTGVVSVNLDKITNRLATPACPDDYYAAFIAGTEPKDTCDQSSGGGISGFFSRIFGGGQKPSAPPAVSNPQVRIPGTSASPQPAQPAEQQNPQKKKSGFWGGLVGKGNGDEKKNP